MYICIYTCAYIYIHIYTASNCFLFQHLSPFCLSHPSASAADLLSWCSTACTEKTRLVAQVPAVLTFTSATCSFAMLSSTVTSFSTCGLTFSLLIWERVEEARVVSHLCITSPYFRQGRHVCCGETLLFSNANLFSDLLKLLLKMSVQFFCFNYVHLGFQLRCP